MYSTVSANGAMFEPQTAESGVPTLARDWETHTLYLDHVDLQARPKRRLLVPLVDG
jgi:hypothetical protein